ncbi:MAG: class I SAM-dependent methyltransferase [Chlorobium sp.]|uniref:class I SAM-dependent methyltransferase n=1 Tax=Chlorobium sp. TaxID=1095 RepID=UPI0025C0393D|nr:class I SAM-dependent methyltransferase [Chlorobium sp.]MCF8383536.1 class I SAM-dependent methyltransferase [Chlorobium sp.]
MSFYSEFAPYYEQVFPFREDVYAFLKGYAGVPGGPVLDIGCGPGHYCGRFARDGFSAVGIDLDSRMIAAAKASYPQASFHCMDMVDAGGLRGPFMLVYSIGNVLSHLSPGKLEQFIAEVFSLLAPGGYWALQVVNWEALLHRRGYLFPVKTLAGGELTFHRRYSGITPEQVRFTFLLKSGDKAVFSEEFTLYPVTSDRYRQLHERAGFLCAGSYGAFGGEAFSGERSAALVMVFRKGE